MSNNFNYGSNFESRKKISCSIEKSTNSDLAPVCGVWPNLPVIWEETRAPAVGTLWVVNDRKIKFQTIEMYGTADFFRDFDVAPIVKVIRIHEYTDPLILTLECILTAYVDGKAIDSNYRYINKLINYSENINEIPFEHDYKPYHHNLRHGAVLPNDNVLEAFGARRILGIINAILPGKASTTTPSTTTKTVDENPVNKGFFEGITTTTTIRATNWLSNGVTANDNKPKYNSNKSPDSLFEPLNIIPDHEDKTEVFKYKEMKDILFRLIDVLSGLNTKLEKIIPTYYSHNIDENITLSNEKSNENSEEDLNIKLQATTPKHQLNEEKNIELNKNDDIVLDDRVKSYRRRYSRQVDNTGKIPVEVMSVSMEKNATEDQLLSTKIKPIDLNITDKTYTQQIPKLVNVNIKKENELHKKYSVNVTNSVQHLNLSEILTEFQKRTPTYYIGKNASVTLSYSDGKVNESKIFNIRVKRKINETGVNGFSKAISDKLTSNSKAAGESVIGKVKTSNVTKNEILNKAVTEDDHTQVTPKISCNESNQIPNGRRSYNSDETPSEVKQKLLQYMDETFAEIFEKIQPLEDIKRSFGTQDMYRVGYIAANLDTLDANLRNLKTELESNKDLWSDKKIMDIFDKVMTTNKIVSNLLTALQTFSLHDMSSSAQPYVSYSGNYYPKIQPGLY